MSNKILLDETFLSNLQKKIQSLQNTKDITELKKLKNQLLKEVKEAIHLANQQKSQLLIEIQQLLQQVYDVFKTTLQHLEESSKTTKLPYLMPYNTTIGELHPITKTIRKISHIMNNLQFEWQEAPEVDYISNIFDKLNMNELHPAREDQQSFYIENHKEQTLRTHCTNFQAHILTHWNEVEELRKFHIGKVYRCDSDATHTPMFHQFEVLYVNKDASLATLMGFIERFFQLFFNKNIKIRIRTSYFPFTTPSYEVDILLDGKWLEIGGCGIVHQNVFILNNKKPTLAWAWGMGVERLTMIAEGYKDIRNFYKTDIRYF